MTAASNKAGKSKAGWTVREESPYRLHYAGSVIDISSETAEQLRKAIAEAIPKGEFLVAEFKESTRDGLVVENTIVIGPSTPIRLVRPVLADE